VRILIVKTSSMGDVVHALPLVTDLAAHVPGAQIDWLVEESFAAIPSMSRHVHRVHRVALRRWRHAPLNASNWREVTSIRGELRAARYDWVLDVQGLLKSAWMARWTGSRIAGPSSDSARERIASKLYSHRVDVSREMHAVERCRRIGAAVFGYAVDDRPRFDLSVSARSAIQLDAPYAVLLANASRATKLWPEDRWIALEDRLAERGLMSALFWSTPEEEARAARLVKGMRRAVVAPRSPIDSIAATLAASRVVVGLDTGLTHLAAALGCPTVGIYCDYDPRLVGLVGDGPVKSLGGVADTPSLDDVRAATIAVMSAAR
jgi:heptosyltransferase-1